MRDAGGTATVISQTIQGRFDLAALSGRNPRRYPYLLASTAESATPNSRARYDLLLAFPQASLELTQQGELVGSGMSPEGDGFLSALDKWWQGERLADNDNTPRHYPFQGGWFLYLGYELANEIEPGLALPTDDNSRLPIACATRIPAAVIYDHNLRQTHIIAEQAYADCIAQIAADLKALQAQAEPGPGLAVELEEEQPGRYLAGVERVRQYIVDGDVFQVNLSRQWQGDRPDGLAPVELFKQLARTNPAPFAACACFGEQAIISSSPERLVRTGNGMIETRPIAGTRPRGTEHDDDKALQAELMAHPKERAEHIMLIDLERNDLGRVCQPGSIKVNELMVLETYAHVHHIVSNVQGQLRKGTTPGQVIRAVFPGGTITGCPKVRCMEIIAELEQGTRGAYTGSLGYLNHNGDMDLNILIRTIVLDNGKIRIRAGAGLVADSDPQRELAETRAKAKGMLMSLDNLTTVQTS